MDARDCFKVLREIKDVSFATVDRHGHPQSANHRYHAGRRGEIVFPDS